MSDATESNVIHGPWQPRTEWARLKVAVCDKADGGVGMVVTCEGKPLAVHDLSWDMDCETGMPMLTLRLFDFEADVRHSGPVDKMVPQ